MSEHYFCPHHGTDCQDVPDDLGNFCENARTGKPKGHHAPTPT